jgi:urease gamma subunit
LFYYQALRIVEQAVLLTAVVNITVLFILSKLLQMLEFIYLLGYRQVLPGVAEMIGEVQVEGTFPDGTKLVIILFEYISPSKYKLNVTEHALLKTASINPYSPMFRNY